MEPTHTQRESSIKLNIDDYISSRRFNIFTALVFILFGGVILLASYSPSTFLERTRAPANTLTSVYTRLGYEEKPFSLPENPVLSVQVNELRSLNKFVTISLTPFKLKTHQRTLVNATLEVSAFTLRGVEVQEVLFFQEKREITFDCSYFVDEYCSQEQILNVPVNGYSDFYFVVKIMNPQELEPFMDTLQVTSNTLSITYRIYIFSVKLFFLLVTLAGFFWNSAKMKKISKDFYNQEQKTFPFLTGLLVFINQPFSIYVFEGRRIHAWVMTILMLWLSVSLIWYWLKTTYELAGSNSSVISRTSRFVKFYTFAYLFVILTVFVTLSHKILNEPTFEFSSSDSEFLDGIKYVLFATLLTGVGWIAWKLRSIIRRMNVITERENSFFWFSLFFILCHFYMVGKGYLCPLGFDGPGAILFCGISTLYVLATNYAYLPTKEGVAEAEHEMKYNNPAARDCYKDLEASEIHHGPPKKFEEDHGAQHQELPIKEAPVKKVSESSKYPYERQEDEV